MSVSATSDVEVGEWAADRLQDVDKRVAGSKAVTSEDLGIGLHVLLWHWLSAKRAMSRNVYRYKVPDGLLPTDHIQFDTEKNSDQTVLFPTFGGCEIQTSGKIAFGQYCYLLRQLKQQRFGQPRSL